MTDELDVRMRWILGAALLSILIGGTADLMLDHPAHWLSAHVLFETAMIAGALLMATSLWLGWWHSERAAAQLRSSIESHRAERDAWKASAQAALEGLARAIDEQFRAWKLTPTEREVALMLLKGLGHKEIAAITGRSERTVRQHAGVVYDKAGLAGRAELAAFFLQDLMLPEPEREMLPVGQAKAQAAAMRHVRSSAISESTTITTTAPPHRATSQESPPAQPAMLEPR